MQIHTVKDGDTLFNISRRYSTSPMKIIENNNLENPGRLAVGQKLLILSPTRTYTVRGGDTLSRIAERFGIKYECLLANNPYLSGSDRIYPGQVLSIKHDSPIYGIACANGYYYPGCREERLMLAMPYMTHLTVAAFKREGGRLKRQITDTRNILALAKRMGKLPLMRIFDPSDAERFDDSYIEEITMTAMTDGYRGITVAAYRLMEEKPDVYADFMMRLKKRAAEGDLYIFCEIDGNKRQKLIPDFCDGCVIMYEKCSLPDIPTFDEGELAVYSDIASRAETSKMYIDLSPFAVAGGEEISKYEAENLARSAHREIKYDSERGICYFDYNKYRGGKKESVRVVYESLENIKAKLALIGELGLMGMSFDIMRVPVEHLMMFACMFGRPGTNYQDSEGPM